MPNRSYYAAHISDFLASTPDAVLGKMAQAGSFSLETSQRDAWLTQIEVLRACLVPYGGHGTIHFEYSIPRLGRRIDALILIDHVLFVVEFKVGAREFAAAALDQVMDYALDLKNFHETSHDKPIVPILVATQAAPKPPIIAFTAHGDDLFHPICSTSNGLGDAIRGVLAYCTGPSIDPVIWEAGRYSPTPTIVEAAKALYAGHSVADISRGDAGALNLGSTSAAIESIISTSKQHSHKSICFVTGVPGAGKTLVGLNVATQHIDNALDLYSVFLSGNGPLVAILREALARDKVRRSLEEGKRLRKGQASSEVKLFVQNVHQFRDECLLDSSRPPLEHVAIFDEAQRAWDQEQTAKFMRQKRRLADFGQSEPQFLISCLNRHPDWAVIVCLVGGGQEINTGEAGIAEWIRALTQSFPEWHIHISSKLHDDEYGAGRMLDELAGRRHVNFNDDLHLGVSMRSFRAEHVSHMVKHLLDRDRARAASSLAAIQGRYPVVLTRDLDRAKSWLREQARGSERFGMMVSSQALRLKPHAIDVRSPTNPVHWFLGDKADVRSSYYLEDAATEFHVQGLEVDWGCVVWDGDFRYTDAGWDHFSFVGDRWNRIRKEPRQRYLKNAYRVLLTRARQGMVVVVPQGTESDPTRSPDFYDPTFEYLKSLGFDTI